MNGLELPDRIWEDFERVMIGIQDLRARTDLPADAHEQIEAMIPPLVRFAHTATGGTRLVDWRRK